MKENENVKSIRIDEPIRSDYPEGYYHHVELEKAIRIAKEDDIPEHHGAVFEIMQEQIVKRHAIIAPVERTEGADGAELHQFRYISDTETEKKYIPIFTSLEELERGQDTDYLLCNIRDLLETVMDLDWLEGLVINPWNDGFCIKQDGVMRLRNNCRLHEAIHFATESHGGQYRKGTLVPYIVHPLETMQILRSMNATTELMIAGLLHDTLEDTDTTKEEIRRYFGDAVVSLVAAHSEDKSKNWEERKENAIAELTEASFGFKMLVMADKVSNLRSILQDYKIIGEEIWERFNRPKEKQAWYYGAVQDVLWDMQLYPETADVYWEMVGLYKDLFVSYYLDEAKSVLYQLDTSGDCYWLKKGLPQWKPLEGAIPKKAVQLSRKDAERIEDNWAEPFWKQHALDMEDVQYKLYEDENIRIRIMIADKQLTFFEEKLSTSKRTIETVQYLLDADNVQRLLVQLRFVYGNRYKMETIFKKAFGSAEGAKAFATFCEEVQVVFEYVAE